MTGRGDANANEELARLAVWQAEAMQVALATVVESWGSSPRPAGSHLAINESGAFAGSVSGGCIESAVIAEALEVIGDGRPRLLAFGVSDEEAWEVGLSCGGAIEIFVERVASSLLLEQLLADQQQKRPVARVSRLCDGIDCLVYPDASFCAGELVPTDEQLRQVQEMLHAGQSGLLDDDEPRLMVRSYVASPRLFIIGAVHIARALAAMALTAGFEVTVVDPRRAFCQPQHFPGVTLANGWPDEVLEAAAIDAGTAIVTLSHDPKIDDPALVTALNSPAFYIGALGSKRTHAQRLGRLGELGLAGQAQRIHGPVGLDLGGRAHAEIAVSILAQLVQVRYRRPSAAGDKPRAAVGKPMTSGGRS